jgi:hypothetical protein
MDDRTKIEIDQLYRSVNVLRQAVTQLQQESAEHRRELDEFYKWSNRFAGAVREHSDHQKAEIDELYRWANVTADSGKAKTERLDHHGRLLDNHDGLLNHLGSICMELEDQVCAIMGRLFPKYHAIVARIRKLIGSPDYSGPPFDLSAVKKR